MLKQPITHAQYMADSSNLHQDYYLQFVTPTMLDYYSKQTDVLTKCKASDKWFNEGFTLQQWDRITASTRHMLDEQCIRSLGGNISSATLVCITKAAFRHILGYSNPACR